MSTKSAWFMCGACGFSNHPRANGAEALRASGLGEHSEFKLRPDGAYDKVLVDGATHVCEQCGAGNDHKEAVEIHG